MRLLLLWVAVAVAGCGNPGPRYPKPDREVQVFVIAAGGQKSAFQIGGSELRIRQGDSGVALLASVGWQVDADALEYLAALNPDIDTFNLSVGAKVFVPGDKTKKLSALVDDDRKRRVVNEATIALGAWPLARSALEDAQAQQRGDHVAGMIREVVDRIQSRTLVTSRSFLEVMSSEAKLCAEVWKRIGRNGASAADLQFVQALEDLIKSQTSAFVDDHKGMDLVAVAGRVDVAISTMQRIAGTLRDVRGYRIWYAPMLLHPRAAPVPLGGLSPVTDALTPGNYAIWATIGSNRTPLGLITELSLVELPRGNVKVIQLEVPAR